MHRPPRTQTARGPLGPVELAEAVVLADVSLALTVVGQVVPFGGALLAAAVVPLAVVGSRHRLRAVIAGAIAAAAVGFLVIGTAAFTTMGACAALGALVGAGDRRNWSSRKTIGVGLATIWPVISMLTLGALLVFTSLRKLTLDQVRNGWTGFFRLARGILRGVAWLVDLLRHVGLGRVSGWASARITSFGDRFTRWGVPFVAWVVRNWWVSIPVTLFLLIWFGIWLAYALSVPALRRVRGAFGNASFDDA